MSAINIERAVDDLDCRYQKARNLKIMNAEAMLFLFSIFMAFGSFIFGSIPLVCHLSEAKLKKVTCFGAGLLIGTAFTVIIPEGIKAVLRSSGNHMIDSVVGLSLLIGFIFMLAVDQLSKRFSRLDSRSQSGALTITIGLVVHAAADGVALGAAATTSQLDIEMIIFLAIMMHKAPAAFGLVTFLLHENIERQTIRKCLLVFSLAAPLLSLVTYFGIGTETKATLSSSYGPGIAMLFSAGTFLYVAIVHVLSELIHKSAHYEALPTTQVVTQTFLDSNQLFLLTFGCLLPYFMTLSHHG